MMKYIIYPVIFKRVASVEWTISVKSMGNPNALHALISRNLWWCIKTFIRNYPRYIKHMHKS